MQEMRKVILLVAMAAALAIVSTAVAVASQQPPGFDPQAEWSDEEMLGWMADEWDEMPMFRDSAVEGGGEWPQWHEEMRGWMADEWDGMRFGGPRTGEEEVGWCHGIGPRA